MLRLPHEEVRGGDRRHPHLVRVEDEGADARDAEVPSRHLRLVEKGEDEAAERGVHVEKRLVKARLPDRVDRIHLSELRRSCDGDDGGGVPRHGLSERIDVEAVFIIVRDLDKSHSEEVRRLLHGEVCGLRGDDLLPAGRVPRHPKGGDVPLGGAGDREPAKVLPMEEVREDSQGLPLEPPRALVVPRVPEVRLEEHGVGPPGDRQGLRAHAPQDLAVAEVKVVLGGLPELPPELRSRDAALLHAPDGNARHGKTCRVLSAPPREMGRSSPGDLPSV